jgi:PAS domain S-box-containing protein
LVNEINLTGSALLGVGRAQLLNRRFSTLVAPQDRDRWHRLVLGMIEHGAGGKQTFGLEMIGADGTVFYAQLNCLRRDSADAPPILWVALSNIDKIKQAEHEAS